MNYHINNNVFAVIRELNNKHKNIHNKQQTKDNICRKTASGCRVQPFITSCNVFYTSAVKNNLSIST